MGSQTTGGPTPGLARALLIGAAAGGMGWGIRGQYGHETGAMIAGALVSLALCLHFARHLPSATVARAVAWGTVAIGFGGSMTYGQTIGLTQNPGMVGNTQALLWGMLGLSIKGALWIGFAGVFLGMGLSATRYRTRDILFLYGMMLGACALGIAVLNEPYVPTERLLPRIYFSADWRWTPDPTPEVLKPRRETWGGFLFAMIALLAQLAWMRRDGLAVRLGLWGLVGGAIGFPLGQCLQAGHAWHKDLFAQGWAADADRVINWWNFMETTFGATMGAALALGLWMSRDRINAGVKAGDPPPSTPHLPAPIEWVLLTVHLVLLVGVEFLDSPPFNLVYDFGLMLGLIPIIGIANGRFWPWFVITVLTLIPIAGKTYRNLVVEEATLQPVPGALLYLVMPIGLAAVCFWRLRRHHATGDTTRWLAEALLFNSAIYFLLNNAFFRFPWPWQAWTTRTPNALIYAACTVILVRIGLHALGTRARGTAGS